MEKTENGTSPEKSGDVPAERPAEPGVIIERPGNLTPAEALAKVKAAVAKGNILFDCCFCHEPVSRQEVSALGIITRWGHPKGEQAYQQWFCHLSCFERLTGETMEAEPEGDA